MRVHQDMMKQYVIFEIVTVALNHQMFDLFIHA